MTWRADRGEPSACVAVHQPRQELLVERAPVHPDPHRLVVADRHFDDFGELLVLLVLEADIAGIDAVFRKRLGAGRMIGEQLVADIVKIADRAARQCRGAGAARGSSARPRRSRRGRP
jgi:hypothetical protein